LAGEALIDVYNAVRRLRRARDQMVQRPEQYVFLHLAVLQFALKKR
jgi:protein tyrosine phosphatase